MEEYFASIYNVHRFQDKDFRKNKVAINDSQISLLLENQEI